MARKPEPALTLLAVAFAVVWSLAAIRPAHPSDFWLENLLVFPTLALLIAGRRRLGLSTRSYVHVFVLLVLHEYGAHWTYAETPFGDRLAAAFGWQRNHYDRLVHFAFGLTMRRPLHELNTGPLAMVEPTARRIVVFEVLALSALYELVEGWAARIVAPDLGTAFLGVQGDPWDAQRDMTCALLGVVFAQLWARGRQIFLGGPRRGAAALGHTSESSRMDATTRAQTRPHRPFETFSHGADVGVRGRGAALALTSIVTEPRAVEPRVAVTVVCEAPDRSVLLVDWLNRLIYEMSTRRMLFSEFDVRIEGDRLQATARGESIDPQRHDPCVEPKGEPPGAVRRRVDP